MYSKENIGSVSIDYYNSTKKTKNFLIFKKYPRLISLSIVFLMVLLSSTLLSQSDGFNNFISSLGYLGSFLAGALYSFALTAVMATYLLLLLAQGQNFFLFLLASSIGTLLSDVLIFFFLKASFGQEVELLQQEKFLVNISSFLKRFLKQFYHTFLMGVSGLLIALPLPTEVGLSLMNGFVKKHHTLKILLIIYIFHTLGIVLIFLLGNV